MFSAAAYSVLPFSDDGTEVRAYFDATFDLSASLTLVLYVSDAAGYATLPGDTPSSQPFQGRLQRFSFQKSILQNDIGQFTTGEGQLVISNTDGFYDQLAQIYAIDGRPITIRIGRRDGAYDDSILVARLTAKDWTIDSDNIVIDLVDFSYKLEVPMQPNVYGGSGGVDGTADLAGKRKPLAFGAPRNVSPVFLVPSLLIYQAHDGPLQAVDAVYDRGALLTNAGDVADYAALVAASVSAGTYKTCLALGFIKLGSSASGTVTADLQGDNSDGYVTTTADIVRWSIRNRTALVDPDDLSTSSFDALNSVQPAAVDYFLGPDDDLTVAAFIEKLMGGVGGWGGHRFDGTFEVRIFEAPTGSPSASFTRADMLGGDIKREALPDAYRPPPYRWRVPYSRNWTVQTDLAGSVGATRKAFVAEAYRLAEATSTTIQTDHPFAQDRDPVGAYFASQADAQAEADRRIDLFKTTRAIYRMQVPRRGLRRDMGDVIMVTHPRFDLPFGRSMTVVEVGIDIDFTQKKKIDSVEIAAYG